MANAELLNNIKHKDLKIITRKSPLFGDNVGLTLTFPTEFSEIQKEYPIFFRKDPETAGFQSVVMFGFDSRQNLFLDDNGWHANYIPAVINRDPFLIGFRIEVQDGNEIRIPMIHVDMDSSRVSVTEGEPVFLEHGGNTPYLESVSKMLSVINEGIEANKFMFAAFLELDLIEPLTLDVELNNRATYQLHGYYTINQEKFSALDDAALGQLHRSGFLHSAYMIIASLDNVRKLIDKCNQLL